MKPLISVIIPVYNVEKYLPKCLESVLSQTLANIEVIVVNDGSTDNSGRLLDEYAKMDSRLKVIHKQNEGVSEARNEALKHVQGEFVSFVDSDDWVESDMYEIMYNLSVEKSADVVMCGYVREFIDHSKKKVMDIADGKMIKKNEICQSFMRQMIGPVSDEKFITENLDMHSVVWNKIYHTYLIKDINFCPLKEIGSCEDLLFNLDVFIQADSVIYIDKPYYHYRKTSTASVTNRYRPDLGQQRINLIEKIRIFIDHNNCPSIYHEALNNRICLGVMGLGLNTISPYSNLSFLDKIRHIKEMLSDKQISLAIQNFNTTNLPLHWRVFYFFVKKRNAVCFYLMIKTIKLLICIIR